MSDVGRKVVPDKGRPNRERPVIKALEFPSIVHRKVCFVVVVGWVFFSSGLERRVRDRVYTRGRMSGMVAEYQYHQRNGKQMWLS